jgi:hypothetical protein
VTPTALSRSRPGRRSGQLKADSPVSVWPRMRVWTSLVPS